MSEIEGKQEEIPSTEKKKKRGKNRKHKRKTNTVDEEDTKSEEGDEVDLRRSIERNKIRAVEKSGQLPPLVIQYTDEYLCVTAVTALLLPFKWSNPTTAVLSTWVNELLKRKLATPDGKKISLFDETTDLPEAVANLDPLFRQTLGWSDFHTYNDDDEFEPYNDGNDMFADELCRRLILRPEALEILFPSPGLVAKQRDQLVQQQVKLIEVEIVGFPLGTAVLKYIVDWLPSKNHRLTLEEFRSWLFLSKFRQKVETFEGWLLDTNPKVCHYTSKQQKNMGVRLCKALHCSQPVSLTAIGNWLLLNSHENPERPPQRLGRFAKRCYHHSVVVIDRELATNSLEEYLFHLKRAYGQKNRPPPKQSGEDRHSKTDRIIRPRSNRYLGMSREGTVSLSWPSREEDDYEVVRWPKVFLGIYLILATHIQGEKAILLELSNLSAHAGSLLKQISWEGDIEDSLQNMSKMRRELGSLAALMTRYTLQMSSDDCGGLSEYVEFFSSLRSIFGIRKQRSELREEIQDVLALVESSYLEEQRKFSKYSQFLRQREKRMAKERDDIISTQHMRFQNIFTVVSIFTLPLMILGSIFGMNLTDLPVQLPFLSCLAVTLSISFVLLIIFVGLSCSHKPPPEVPLDDPISRMSLSLDLDRPGGFMDRLSLDRVNGQDQEISLYDSARTQVNERDRGLQGELRSN